MLHPFKVNNFLKSLQFYDFLKYHHRVVQPLPQSVLDYFLALQKETLYPLTHTPRLPLSLAPDSTYLLSVSTDLPTLDIPYEQNHTICCLL